MATQPETTQVRPTGVAPVVRAAGLGKAIDDRAILADINLGVSPGSCVALLGANGAGKSTLLHVLATLIRPTSGTLELFGSAVKADVTAVRARIGLIGHQSMLYRDLGARENLEFFGKLYGLADPRKRADELLERVKLRDRAADPVRTFSRGMAQRLAIARALMHNPDLLLADEPFAGLDVPSTRTVEQLLSDLRAEGRTIIVSNHDVPQSLALAQRVVVLRGGRIVLDESAEHASVQSVTREVVG